MTVWTWSVENSRKVKVSQLQGRFGEKQQQKSPKPTAGNNETSCKNTWEKDCLNNTQCCRLLLYRESISTSRIWFFFPQICNTLPVPRYLFSALHNSHKIRIAFFFWSFSSYHHYWRLSSRGPRGYAGCLLKAVVPLTWIEASENVDGKNKIRIFTSGRGETLVKFKCCCVRQASQEMWFGCLKTGI